MILIIGLGNPGKKFEKTRHNVGFRAVTAFQAKNGFSDFKFSKKFKAETSEVVFDNEKIILGKPQTFMNNSGKAVKALINNRQLAINNLFVVHDDIDLPLGKIRISVDRSSAGHKGVESIIRELKNKNFARFRIGIKTEGNEQKIKNRKQRVEKFVLKKFTTDEEKILKKVIEKTVEAIEITIKEGVEKAMAKYN